MYACCKQITGVQSRADRVSRDFPSAMIPDEEYLAVGIYEDGTPGEIFITTAERGLTVSGLMDCFVTAVSLALQYGVSLYWQACHDR